MKLIKTAVPLSAVIVLSGCQISSKAPGVWYGVAYDQESGGYSEVAMFVTEAGETRISTTAGLNMAGLSAFDGDILYSLPSSNYGSEDPLKINPQAKLLISGEFSDAAVTIEVMDKESTIQKLDLVKSSDAAATQGDYAGIWYANPHNPSPDYTWSIDDSGNITGNDESGCQYHGTVSASSAINVADLSLVISECDYSGFYLGVMSLFNDPSSDRVGIFYNYSNHENIFVNGLEKIL
ncbi:hypothetical protein [Gynuella sunshinyii]|uniref:Lipoprotein n=1 Tax=Gynuella sunshinyii YC6258 TaxID=1445510 RepID=A0A0C5VM54_9GAMM|nr:hypothetical protein [Gynuella sunshinyii]AJQ95777.1 hypothetical Protein YC6258_03741 [Gynuella sunshinyii YC6258]DAC80060.1 TPA_exp: hypothetical protein [Gynuella sunshinyii YC6258]